jgi:tetratricopeptide (TPR) repeat protein
MSKNAFLAGLLLLLNAAGIWGLDTDSGGYGSLSDWLNDIYGIDENAGLTAFPVLRIPTGGKSEAMAGTFTAVADDASFLEWNPAGSSMLSQSELAFFHNNWIADTKVEGAVFAYRIRNLGIAAGGKWLYTPFTEYNLFGERSSKGYYSEAVAALNCSYNFFSGYYFSGISLGMNLKGAFRFVPDYSDDMDRIIAGSGVSQSSAMAMADIGVLTRFDLLKPYISRDRNASAALTLRNLGPPAMADPLPTVITGALSYKPLRPLLLAFDYSVPLNLQDPGLSEAPYWSAGVSVTVTDFLSMGAGFLSKAGNARIALGSVITMGKVALDVNYTLDLLTQLSPLNRVSLGVRFNLGDQGRKERAAQVDRLYLTGLAAYSRGSIEEARHYFEEALVLDPRFDPARESLEIIRRIGELEERINTLERLDL